jgi:hypothetical protein
MIEKLRPSFEEEFPDQGQLWSDGTERRYELGLINAHEADLASRQPAAKVTPPVIENPEQLILFQPAKIVSASKQSPQRERGFIRKADGAPDGRYLTPAERRAAERLPEDQWNLR